MHPFASAAFRGLSLLLLPAAVHAADALRLNPANPRYFEWRGQPLVIVGSGEHYGAVLNADFDFAKYLATLGRDGLNHTRLFTGAAYVEPEGAFNIARNTLAPPGDRYLPPWARSSQPGYTGGGARFDLARWNPAYFERLRAFVAEAGRHRVIVEVNLFCPFYEESQWRLSPFHPDNNVQGAGRGVARTNVYTLDHHGGLLTYQERFVREVVQRLRDFDNLYYEICNEPYFGGVTLEWQAHIAALIADAQKDHPNPKLISQNIANNQARVEHRLPHVSIYNFHYAAPPTTVAMNWHLERPIGDNETGFRGTHDAPYRMEAWDFFLAGGALFSHLDYSFTVGHEDGTFQYPASQPGGGNPALRRSFRALRQFVESFDFLRAEPASDRLRVEGLPLSHSFRALTFGPTKLAAYFRPSLISRYSVRWTGFIESPETAEYTLHATSNDGMRVWVGDRLVIDRWVEQSETEHRGNVRLEQGRHPLKIEYFYNGGQAAARLAWSRPGHAASPIPSTALRLPDSDQPGLRGEYFLGTHFDQAWQTRTDPMVDFAWGTKPPFAASPEALPSTLRISSLPEGRWSAAWVDPNTGSILSKPDRLRWEAGTVTIPAPAFREDIALRLEQP